MDGSASVWPHGGALPALALRPTICHTSGRGRRGTMASLARRRGLPQFRRRATEAVPGWACGMLRAGNRHGIPRNDGVSEGWHEQAPAPHSHA